MPSLPLQQRMLYRLRPLREAEPDAGPPGATRPGGDGCDAGARVPDAKRRILTYLRAFSVCPACDDAISDPTLLGCGCCVCRPCVPAQMSPEEAEGTGEAGVAGPLYRCPCCTQLFRFHVPNGVGRKLLAIARQMDAMMPEPSAPSEYTS